MVKVWTSSFRRQHEGILEEVAGILGILEFEAIRDNSYTIRKKITKLAGIVKIHLVLEDNSLYPVLANIDSGILKETAAQFMDEMGDISKSFTEYLEKWSTVSSIKSETNIFVSETQTILSFLKQRITRENEIFYKLIDKYYSK